MPFRYFIQIIVMLTDLALIGASAVIICIAPFEPIVWIIIGLSYIAWQEQGGFIGWKIKHIKDFLCEAKKIDL